MSRTFGPVTQIAYVTRDLREAIAFFVETAGIGPWFVSENRAIPNAAYRGETVDVHMSVALANSGSIQMEIIAPVGPGKSMYQEWVAAHPSDLLVQHLSSQPENYDQAHGEARSKGYEIAMEGVSPQGRIVYFQHPDRPEFTFELAEMTQSRRRTFDAIRAAAEGWDGTDPIRPWP